MTQIAECGQHHCNHSHRFAEIILNGASDRAWYLRIIRLFPTYKSSYLINLHYFGFLNNRNVSARIVWVRGPGPGNYVTSQTPEQTKYFIIHTQGGQTILNFNVNAGTIVLSWHNAAGLDWLSTFNSFVEFITFFSGTNCDNNEQNSYGVYGDI